MYTTSQLAKILRDQGYDCEIAGSDYVVIRANGRDFNTMIQILWNLSYLPELGYNEFVRDGANEFGVDVDLDVEGGTNDIYVGEPETICGLVNPMQNMQDQLDDAMHWEDPDGLSFYESKKRKVSESKKRSIRGKLREGIDDIPFDDCSDLFCSRCGEPITADMEVCPECGMSLVSEYCQNGYDERTYDPFEGYYDIDTADEDEVYDEIYGEDVFECRNAVDYKKRSIKDPTGTRHLKENLDTCREVDILRLAGIDSEELDAYEDMMTDLAGSGIANVNYTELENLTNKITKQVTSHKNYDSGDIDGVRLRFGLSSLQNTAAGVMRFKESKLKESDPLGLGNSIRSASAMSNQTAKEKAALAYEVGDRVIDNFSSRNKGRLGTIAQVKSLGYGPHHSDPGGWYWVEWDDGSGSNLPGYSLLPAEGVEREAYGTKYAHHFESKGRR